MYEGKNGPKPGRRKAGRATGVPLFSVALTILPLDGEYESKCCIGCHGKRSSHIPLKNPLCREASLFLLLVRTNGYPCKICSSLARIFFWHVTQELMPSPLCCGGGHLPP